MVLSFAWNEWWLLLHTRNHYVLVPPIEQFLNFLTIAPVKSIIVFVHWYSWTICLKYTTRKVDYIYNNQVQMFKNCGLTLSKHSWLQTYGLQLPIRFVALWQAMDILLKSLARSFLNHDSTFKKEIVYSLNECVNILCSIQ